MSKKKYRYSIIHVQHHGAKLIHHTIRYGIQTEDEAWRMVDHLITILGFPEKELEVYQYKVKRYS